MSYLVQFIFVTVVHVCWYYQLSQTGLRELFEETGLRLTEEDCVGEQLLPLALWEVWLQTVHCRWLHPLVSRLFDYFKSIFLPEFCSEHFHFNTLQSVYPPKLSLGAPARHHVVVYLYAKLKSPLTSERLLKEVIIDPNEVAACVWLDREIVSAIVNQSEESGCTKDLDSTMMPDTLRYCQLSLHFLFWLWQNTCFKEIQQNNFPLSKFIILLFMLIFRVYFWGKFFVMGVSNPTLAS